MIGVGSATAGETPVTITHYLRITPKWVDGTAVGGCTFISMSTQAAATIASGLCETVPLFVEPDVFHAPAIEEAVDHEG